MDEPLAVAPLNQLNENVPTAPAEAIIEPLSAPPAQFVEGVGAMVTVGGTVPSAIATLTGCEVQFVRLLVTVAVNVPLPRLPNVDDV